MVLSEFDKRVLKTKIDFLINASKFEILFIAKHFTSTTTATKTQQPAVYNIVCNTNLRNCILYVNNPKIRTIKCRTETST